MAKTSDDAIYKAIFDELDYQIQVWPDVENHTIDDLLLTIKGYYQDTVQEAAKGYSKGMTLDGIRKLAGLCFRCVLNCGHLKYVGKPKVEDCGSCTPACWQVSDQEEVRNIITAELDYYDTLKPLPTSMNYSILRLGVQLDTGVVDRVTTPHDHLYMGAVVRMLATLVSCMRQHGVVERFK